MAGDTTQADVDPERAAERARDERLVLALRSGDADAFGRLYDAWYDRVHDLARRITRDDLLAADVAQDAFLAAWQRLDGLDDPASFGGWLLRIARNRALDVVRAPSHNRTDAVAEMSDVIEERPACDRLAGFADPADIAADHEVQQLVWDSAAALGERDLTALDLHLRHGLDPAEIGDVLGINRNAANQLVHRMRGRLATAVSCRLLWQGGRPRCPRLFKDLVAAGSSEFDAEALRVTDRHAKGCADCTRRRESRVDPTKLFAAMPITVVTLAAKQKTAAALSAQGVPMGGSTAATTTSGEPSSGADGSGGRHDPPADPDARPPSSRRRARLLALVGVAVTVVLAALVLWEERVGDGLRRGGEDAAAPRREAVAASTTTTTAAEGDLFLTPRPGTSASTVVAAPDATPGDDEPAVVSEPLPDDPAVTVPPPPPPPPPPAAPQGSISAAPSRVGTVHPTGQAVISWSTSGATSVSVSGPGLASSSASGSQSVCPGAVVSSVCRSQAGTYTYVLTVSGPGGSVRRQATLTVG